MKELNCEGCEALCCREVSVHVGFPEREEDWDEWKWIVSHKNCSIVKDEDDWLVCFEADCKFLDKDWKCTVYDNRHKVCREYAHEDCPKHNQDDFEVVLKSPEDVEALRKRLQK